MPPILNGPPGFVLLALAAGLGAYIRQVYVSASETYDKLNSGELKRLWPLDEQYTKERLYNLIYVQDNLIRVTKLMFFFIIVLSLRLVAYAISAFPADTAGILNDIRIPDAALYYWDLGLLVYLAIAFSLMWWTHHQGSKKERQYHKAMWTAFERSKSPPQST
jgi:hypothetical protein